VFPINPQRGGTIECNSMLNAEFVKQLWVTSQDPRMNDVRALAARDQAQWFCSAIDPTGTPRVWAKGSTEAEARKRAELAVTAYRDSKQSYRVMAPRADWVFAIYPPDQETTER
jgi:hypothetical protein